MVKLFVDTPVPDTYEVAEACRQLGIGYATLYRWIKANKLIPLRIGGRTLIPKSEVEKLRRDDGGG